MTGGVARGSGVPASLSRLRRRLTIWYAATFLVILVLLGVGMFAVITRRFDSELDESLAAAAGEVARFAQQHGIESGIGDLKIPERRLTITDARGRTVAGEPAEPWVAELAARAAASGPTGGNHSGDNDRILRARAVPFRQGSGSEFVAVAVADEVELEDRYTSLIAAFAVAATAAVVLVAAGGWIVAGQSTAPIERNIEQMRRFMGDAAHELRTPLAVLRSRAEVASRRTRDPAEYEAALQTIEHESARLGSIVDDLLTLSRADAGERPMRRARVFLDDIVVDAANAMRGIAERKGVKLALTEYEEAAVSGDAELLRRLVLILLDNAVKFSDRSGEVRVSVTADGSTAVLRVSDEGVGITPDQLSHVFERFYRGDPARARTGGETPDGAGLGLSIAHWITEQHGGAIRLESGSGQGTVATVHFPLADSHVLSPA